MFCPILFCFSFTSFALCAFPRPRLARTVDIGRWCNYPVRVYLSSQSVIFFLWLCQSPGPAVHSGVWLVVCLAALAAMEHGRRQLWRLHRVESDAARAPGGRQRTLLDMWGGPPPPEPSLGARAAALAVADFWGRLTNFAHSCTAPASWTLEVPANHPFLSHGGSQVSLPAHLAPAPPSNVVVAPSSSVGLSGPPRPRLRQLRLTDCWEPSPSSSSVTSAAMFEASVAPLRDALAELGWD